MRTVKMFLIALPALLLIGLSDLSGSRIAMAAPEDAPAAAPAAPAAPAAQPKTDININLGGGDKRAVWLLSPTVLAVGGVGLLAIIAIIAMASRGGGTTIIRER